MSEHWNATVLSKPSVIFAAWFVEGVPGGHGFCKCSLPGELAGRWGLAGRGLGKSDVSAEAVGVECHSGAIAGDPEADHCNGNAKGHRLGS